MNPEYKRIQNGYKTLEYAKTAFKDLRNGRYKLVKDSDGILVAGGLYSIEFVTAFARNNEDVVIIVD